MRKIHAGQLPLSVTHGHQISLIVVGWSSPEVGLRNHLDHFHAAETIGYQSAVQIGEHGLKIFSPHADVMDTVDHLKGCVAAFLLFFHTVNRLSESHLMAFRGPEGIFFQQEGNCHRILSGK